MTEEDTGIVTTTRSRPLLRTNKATVASAPLMAARAVTNVMVALTDTTVTMAAVALEVMAEEEPLSQVHSTAITLIPRVDSPIVSLIIQLQIITMFLQWDT